MTDNILFKSNTKSNPRANCVSNSKSKSNAELNSNSKSNQQCMSNNNEIAFLPQNLIQNNEREITLYISYDIIQYIKEKIYICKVEYTSGDEVEFVQMNKKTEEDQNTVLRVKLS